jgi:hypothetical protein
MKAFKIYSVFLFVFFSFAQWAKADNGFRFEGSNQETTIKYWSYKNLIVLPVTINDTVNVNLILDSGCPNLVLFGKDFYKSFKYISGRKVKFSGLGEGKQTEGLLSIGNKVFISKILGKNIPVVLVNRNRIFENNIDGVIGYELFIKFEIEINPFNQTITFRSAAKGVNTEGFSILPLRLDGIKPIIISEIKLHGNKSKSSDLMVDTGSSVGLLYKTTNARNFDFVNELTMIGSGLNGRILAFETVAKNLSLGNIELINLDAKIIKSRWHDEASMGMGILKDYIVVLNYCKSYMYLKRPEEIWTRSKI